MVIGSRGLATRQLPLDRKSWRHTGNLGIVLGLVLVKDLDPLVEELRSRAQFQWSTRSTTSLLLLGFPLFALLSRLGSRGGTSTSRDWLETLGGLGCVGIGVNGVGAVVEVCTLV
jgi:hypothetical protein